MRKTTILTLSIAACLSAPAYAGVVTFHGVQEYLLIDIDGVFSPLEEEQIELQASLSYFQFYIGAPGPVQFGISQSALPDNDYLKWAFMSPCPTEGYYCLKESPGATAGGYEMAISVAHPTNANYGLQWDSMPYLADLTQDYSPVPFTVQISGQHVYDSYDSYLAAVPEPGTMGLLLAGLVGLKRRFTLTAAAAR